MKRQDAGRPRSRPDHFSDGGDQTAWFFQIDVVALDGSIVHGMRIDITHSNALRLSGHIGDLEVGLSVLDNAKDAVGVFHRLKLDALAVPGKDVDIAKLGKVREVKISGPIENREYALATIEAAKTTLRNHHDMRAIALPNGMLSVEKL